MVPIVIPVFNAYEHVRRCISTLPHSTHVAHQIVVADDCSSETVLKDYLAEQANQGTITLLQLRTRLSYSEVNNWAVAQLAQSKYICLLNSDIEPTVGWLGAMVDVCEEDDQVGIVGARLIYPDVKEAPWTLTIQHAGVARTPEVYPYHPYRGFLPNDPRVTKRREINAVTAACMLVRRSMWDDLGGLDEGFPGGSFEDVDFCWRARENGWKVVYEPEAALYHYEHGSGEEWATYHSERNCRKLRKRWAGLEGDGYLFEDQ